MKKYLLTILVLVFCYPFVSAQKASFVLEHGIPVDKGHRIFLKYDTTNNKKVLKIDANKKIQEADYTTLEDSSIFLVRKNEINVFLRPLNPLNYSCNTETKTIVDPINEAAATALGELIGMLGQVLPTEEQADDRKTATRQSAGECKEFNTIVSLINTIQSRLEKTQKDEIIVLFNKLERISFTHEDSVKCDLKAVKREMKIIEHHFEETGTKIATAKGNVQRYSCDSFSYPDSFVVEYIFHTILKDFSVTLEEQKKRLTNLQKAYQLVSEMQKKASVGGEADDLRWCIPLEPAASTEGKITVYTVTIKESGYTLSANNEIVGLESKDLLKRTFRVRRFQRFIPEVSVGTAFTFLEYNTYGTTTDSTGQQLVASATRNTLRNLNITTMVNFNYYCSDSPIHFLYQLGLGFNSEIPSLLTGLGVRSNINGIRRLTISGGLAMNWIRELQTLHPGDVVGGTDDIDKDFRYSSAPKLTGYVGIQYNF